MPGSVNDDLLHRIEYLLTIVLFYSLAPAVPACVSVAFCHPPRLQSDSLPELMMLKISK